VSEDLDQEKFEVTAPHERAPLERPVLEVEALKKGFTLRAAQSSDDYRQPAEGLSVNDVHAKRVGIGNPSRSSS
jgi:hypothetical protein